MRKLSTTATAYKLNTSYLCCATTVRHAKRGYYIHRAYNAQLAAAAAVAILFYTPAADAGR